MAKRWTHHEDSMLLEHHGAVGADFIAEHDLGRPAGAGTRRLDALTKSGARLAYARMRKHQIEFDALAGRFCLDPESEIALWDEEERQAIQGMSHAR